MSDSTGVTDPVGPIPADVQRTIDAANSLRRGLGIGRSPTLADLDAWARRDYWTRDEAVALSFGIEPAVFKAINERRPRHVRWTIARDRLEIMRREPAAPFRSRVHPKEFVEWALVKKLSLHPRFRPAVEAFGHSVTDYENALAMARAECDRLRVLTTDRGEACSTSVPTARIAELEAQLAAAGAEASKKAAGVRERETLLCIIIAMAHENYGYFPSERSTAAKDINSATSALGIRRSDDTIRPLLAEAAELVDADVWKARRKER